MRGFKKGEDPRRNINGRPKGRANRTTEQVRAVIGDIITENLPRIREAIKNMDDVQLVTTVERLLRHYLPAPLHSIEQFSEDDLQYLLSKLKDKQHETSSN